MNLNLEQQVNKLLNYLNIHYPHEIDIEAIAFV